MELNGERLIPASIDATWAALNDPEILKACIAGCESLERVGDDGFAAVVAMKIGPVSARFKGSLKLTRVDPPRGYTINFDGQGGVAGFGRGSADVSLSDAGAATTRLSYSARATVGGKMAQIGSRLIDATAAKITDDFFKAFEAQLQARAPAPAPATAPPMPPGIVAAPARAREPAGPVGWTLAAIVVVATLYLVTR
jgi:carbon monoxide dehydrogenase subunit G